MIVESCNRAFSVIQSSQKALQVEEIKVLHKLFSVSEGIPERPKKFQLIFFFFFFLSVQLGCIRKLRRKMS